MRAVAITALLLLIAGAPAVAQPQVLLEFGSPMKYKANKVDPLISPALDWTTELFPDGGWADGNYGVGYDTSGTASALFQTTVDPGTESIYTRTRFWIDDVNAVQTLFLGVDYDDGHEAWINGTQVACSAEMPTCSPAWDTDAGLHESSNGAVPDYTPLQNISAAAVPVLYDGWNVLAIGVWNGPLPSSDLVLVPQLTMNLPGPDPRGPYVQRAAPDRMVVRWRTTDLQDSRVEFGTDPASLTTTVDDAALDFDHEIELTGLAPDTVYYYSVGSSTTLIAGGDADHFFRTPPAVGTRRPVRIWTLGDSGTANANAEAVRDAYENLPGNPYTDVWLMLGDNAYPQGTEAEYQAAVFETYPEMLRQSALWATVGNHDAVSSSSLTETGPYFEAFTFPRGGESGGAPSGTEAYYSFDYGNIHFLCLDSQNYSANTGLFATWLTQDLMNNTQDWTIAFFHHPPYSKGSHDSDDPADSSGILFNVRQNILPTLEMWGVDLVLTGHSHSYERSFLLDGHYDVSSTLVPGMVLDGGDGRVDGAGAYEKASPGPAGHEGALYVVAGSSGKTSPGPCFTDPLDCHPVMYVSLRELGSLILDVEGDRLEGRFLDGAGTFQDHFTLVKNTAVPPAADFIASPTAGVAPLSVDFSDQSSTNTSSWSWDLDGDAIADSSAQDPAFVYSAPGVYTVELTATNAAGSDVESKAGFICVSAVGPGVVGGVDFAVDGMTVSWSAAANAVGYDVIRGDLEALLAGGGSFPGSGVACVENGDTDLEAFDTTAPAAGGAFYYLVRGIGSCGEPGSYDGGGGGQAAPRDGGIEAAAGNCP